MKIKNVLSCTLVAATLALVGCSSTTTTSTPAAPAAAPGMINSKCPYSGGPANAAMTSDVSGGKIGFCCAGCKGKFDKSDAKAQADLVAKVKN